MSAKVYKSEYKNTPYNAEKVFDSLSTFDFLNLVFSTENINRIKGEAGEKASNFHVKKYSVDKESCEFTISPIGTISLVFVDRKASDHIKIKNIKGPLKFNLDIDIQMIDADNCKLQVILSAELNMMMQMMIGKKLDKVVDKIAESLSLIPFDKLD